MRREHDPLVARGRKVPAGFAALRSRAQIQTAGGECEAQIVGVGFDRRTRTATYALRLVNRTRAPLRAQVICITRGGKQRLAHPRALAVAPLSTKEMIVPVHAGRVGIYDWAVVEVRGAGVAFSVEAPAPSELSWRALPFVRWVGGAVLVTAALAFGAGAATPNLPVFAAPARAQAGQYVDIPFVRTGIGSLQYALTTMHGRQLAAGLATASQGTLRVFLPRSKKLARYHLNVRVDGPFGGLERRATIAASALPMSARPAALPAPAPPVAARIESLSVSPSPVTAGMPLKVIYQTNASSGDVWLIDGQGRNWSHAALQSAGVTWLHVPPNAAGREMRVAVHARTAGGDAVSSIGVVIFPMQPSVGTGSAASAQTAPLSLSASLLHPGERLTARLAPDFGAARVGITDDAGNGIVQRDLAAGGVLHFTAPPVRAASTYYVIATSAQGTGERSTIQSFTIAPR